MADESLGVAEVELRARLNTFQRDLASARRETEQAAGKMQQGFSRVQTGVQGLSKSVAFLKNGLIALGAIQLARKVVSGFNEFDTSLRKIIGLVGVAESEVNEMRDSILELSPAVGKGPNELADALFFVTSAGFRGTEAMDILEKSAKAATAGLGETKTVAAALTSVLSAYAGSGLTAADVTDAMVIAVREGKFEASEFAGALGKVLPVAEQAGVQFHEIGAAVAALSRIGLQPAEAITGIRGALVALSKETKEGQDLLEEYGTSFADIRKQIREEGLIEAFQDLRDLVGDNETAFTTIFGRVEAATAVLALTGAQADTVRKIFDNLAQSTGGLDAAFTPVAEGSGKRLGDALHRIEAVLLDLGDVAVPAFASSLENLGPILEVLIRGVQIQGRFFELFIESLEEAADAAGVEGVEIEGWLLRLARAFDDYSAAISRTSGKAGIRILGTDFPTLEQSFQTITQEIKEQQAELDKLLEAMNKPQVPEALGAIEKGAMAATEELIRLNAERDKIVLAMGGLSGVRPRGPGAAERGRMATLFGKPGAAAEAGGDGGGGGTTPSDETKTALATLEASVAALEREAIIATTVAGKRDELRAIMQLEAQARQSNIDLSDEQRERAIASIKIAKQAAEEEALLQKQRQLEIDTGEDLEMAKLRLQFIRDETGELEVQQRLLEIRREFGEAEANRQEPRIRETVELTQKYKELNEVLALSKTEQQELNDQYARLEELRPALTVQEYRDALANLNEQSEQNTEQQERLKEITEAWGLTFNSALEDAIINGESLDDILQAISEDLQRMALRQFVTAPILQAFGGLGALFGPGGAPGAPTTASGFAITSGRQHGGRVTRGQAYMVGEQGPEPFIPDVSGMIIPHGSFGKSNVEVNVYAPPGSQPQVEESNGGQTIDVMIDEVTAQNMRPGTRTYKAMQTSFAGLRPNLVRR